MSSSSNSPINISTSIPLIPIITSSTSSLRPDFDDNTIEKIELEPAVTESTNKKNLVLQQSSTSSCTTQQPFSFSSSSTRHSLDNSKNKSYHNNNNNLKNKHNQHNHHHKHSLKNGVNILANDLISQISLSNSKNGLNIATSNVNVNLPSLTNHLTVPFR
jgi:hypothetical protein